METRNPNDEKTTKRCIEAIFRFVSGWRLSLRSSGKELGESQNASMYRVIFRSSTTWDYIENTNPFQRLHSKILLRGIVLGLCVPQLLILATTTHKLVMGTVLHDLPVVEHSNLIAEPA